MVDDFVLVGTEKVSSTNPSASADPINLGAASNSCSLTDDTYNGSTVDNTPIFHNLRELYQVFIVYTCYILAYSLL